MNPNSTSLPLAVVNATLTAATTAASASSTGSSSVYHMRLALTVTHLLLVAIGSVNLLVILVILLRPYMRSITNVYMIGLCLADFIYLANLILVAATQINDKSWPFGSLMCTIYHGTETTGKYGSVIFVVLLAADRYCAMCKTNWCARYRNYRSAILASVIAWTIAIAAALPLYTFSEVVQLKFRGFDSTHKLCIAKWPNSESARWYITFSSILIFALPLALIVYCYYHIWNKLREALKGSKRMRRAASSRAPYHRVTRLVLWVVVFHVLCWSPFWLFNLFSSILRLRISTQFDRIIVNIIHLFPYVNCALNPLLYAAHAENFRIAFRSLFSKRNGGTLLDNNARITCSNNNTRSSYYKPSSLSQVPPSSENLLSTSPSSNGVCKGRAHSVLRFSPKYLSPSNQSPCPTPTNDATISPRPSTKVLKSALKSTCPTIDEGYMNPSHSHTSVLTAPTFGSVDLADDLFDLNSTRSVNCLLAADRMDSKRGSVQIGWTNAHAIISSRKPDRPSVDTTGWRKYSDIEAEQRDRTSSLIVPTLLVSRPGDVMV